MTIKKWIGLVFSVVTIFMTTDFLVLAETIPSKPAHSLVYDPNDYLSEETEKEIMAINEQNSKTQEKYQIGVVVVDHIPDNYSIEGYSIEIARKWQIGQKDTNNGSLVTIAIKDREFRYENSDNVTTVLTDGISRSIQGSLVHLLKEGHYQDWVLESVRMLSNSFYGDGDDNFEQNVVNNTENTSDMSGFIFSTLTTTTILVGIYASATSKNGLGRGIINDYKNKYKYEDLVGGKYRSKLKLKSRVPYYWDYNHWHSKHEMSKNGIFMMYYKDRGSDELVTLAIIPKRLKDKRRQFIRDMDDLTFRLKDTTVLDYLVMRSFRTGMLSESYHHTNDAYHDPNFYNDWFNSSSHTSSSTTHSSFDGFSDGGGFSGGGSSGSW